MSEGDLFGRVTELSRLTKLLESARAGHSAVVVLRGEAGVGKTALIEDLLSTASGVRVLRTAGVESDMELPFAGVHRLISPLAAGIEALPDPQRRALDTAFGQVCGPAPDRFLIGLAVLDLIASASSPDAPVLCVVDDAQWLDQVSAQTLGFVARRLLAEHVMVLFASRETTAELRGLPELAVSGLAVPDARELVDAAVLGRIDARVRDRIVAETRGNPLALLECVRDLASADLAGGYHRPDAHSVAATVESRYLQRMSTLGAEARLLLTLAAAEPVGDPALLTRAATRLGIEAPAFTALRATGLIDIDSRVRFRHPLVRSVAYRDADANLRQRVHAALAESIDADADPDRRAWHRAFAASGPDESVAEELDRAAVRAQQRGGIAAAAAFLTHAFELTPDPAQRGTRALRAAQAKRRAADFDAAAELVAAAALSPLDDLDEARRLHLATQLAFQRRRANLSGPALAVHAASMAGAAQRLAPLDADEADQAFLEALCGLIYIGRGGEPAALSDIASATVRHRDGTEVARPVGLLAQGLARRVVSDAATASAAMRTAATSITEHNWQWEAFPLALEVTVHEIWDDDAWERLSALAVRVATDTASLQILPTALVSRAGTLVMAGDLAGARLLIAEAEDISAAIGYAPLQYHKLTSASWAGNEGQTTALAETALRDGTQRGENRVIALAAYAVGVLNNGLGRYQVALAALQSACEYDDLGIVGWNLCELVECAARAGRHDVAADALAKLQTRTRAAGTSWALGVSARSAALLADDADAEPLYRAAIEHLGRSRVKVQLARAHLLYGEWLRRKGRRNDAREQLSLAHDMLTGFGVHAFAERARRELLSVGVKVAKRTRTGNALTPQETQVAELAATGLTNTEIGSQLFISAHTVEWHLSNVYAKLAIKSRRQLRNVELR
ncbi:ATP-binding protein [Mycolicibacterium goodii]|uniref:LuxR family transcriptional regulator n=1 Tax=Mycolicibacterium goodii TaxID=134601 RepID=A0A0K0X2J5_MYCGD|nr:LuxR family transcriptional regulator [Mycolicibacterium goodii]